MHLTKEDILGVVLAGGRARRMGGGDKPLHLLGGRPVMAHVLERLSPQVGSLLINANGDPSRYLEFGYEVVQDLVGGYCGPLAGIHAGLHWAEQSGFRAVVSVAGDTPFFPVDLVSKLSQAVGDHTQIAMAASPADPATPRSARHPTFALWPVRLRQALEDALADGVRRVVEFSEAYGCQLVHFPSVSYDPFFNINTPTDLRHARARIEAEMGDA